MIWSSVHWNVRTTVLSSCDKSAQSLKLFVTSLVYFCRRLRHRSRSIEAFVEARLPDSIFNSLPRAHEGVRQGTQRCHLPHVSPGTGTVTTMLFLLFLYFWLYVQHLQSEGGYCKRSCQLAVENMTLIFTIYGWDPILNTSIKFTWLGRHHMNTGQKLCNNQIIIQIPNIQNSDLYCSHLSHESSISCKKHWCAHIFI